MAPKQRHQNNAAVAVKNHEQKTKTKQQKQFTPVRVPVQIPNQFLLTTKNNNPPAPAPAPAALVKNEVNADLNWDWEDINNADSQGDDDNINNDDNQIVNIDDNEVENNNSQVTDKVTTVFDDVDFFDNNNNNDDAHQLNYLNTNNASDLDEDVIKITDTKTQEQKNDDDEKAKFVYQELFPITENRSKNAYKTASEDRDIYEILIYNTDVYSVSEITANKYYELYNNIIKFYNNCGIQAANLLNKYVTFPLNINEEIIEHVDDGQFEQDAEFQALIPLFTHNILFLIIQLLYDHSRMEGRNWEELKKFAYVSRAFINNQNFDNVRNTKETKIIYACGVIIDFLMRFAESEIKKQPLDPQYMANFKLAVTKLKIKKEINIIITECKDQNVIFDTLTQDVFFDLMKEDVNVMRHVYPKRYECVDKLRIVNVNKNTPSNMTDKYIQNIIDGQCSTFKAWETFNIMRGVKVNLDKMAYFPSLITLGTDCPRVFMALSYKQRIMDICLPTDDFNDRFFIASNLALGNHIKPK
jgi:hypothetical protein